MIINFDSIYRIDEGYGNAGEGILLALDALPAVAVYTEDNWDHTEYQGLQPRTVFLCKRGFEERAEYSIRFSQPDSFGKAPEAKKTIGWCLWEYNNIPNDWIEGIRDSTINFVSCEHNKQLWEQVGANKTFVVKLGINPNIYFYQPREPHEKFTFIISGTLYARKNPRLVYEVFQELFANDINAKLLIKSTARFPVELEPTHNIQIINQVWPSTEMANLLRSGDCFVYPTQGEGFGLCPVESMAVGTTVICTNWSGPTEYLDDKFSYKLDYTLKKCKIENREGLFECAKPDRNHLKELMWHVYTHQAEAKEKGRLASTYVAENLTWAHTANEITKILKQL